MNYYNENTKEFYDKTIDTSMKEVIDRFINYIPKKGTVLDAGCGVGRDIKAFHELGYKVHAFDASIEMCKLAHEVSGCKIKHTTFQEFHSNSKYDGIWACASLLHVERRELLHIFNHMIEYMNEGGVFYMSFKEGNVDTLKDERHFTNLTKEELENYLSKVKGIEILELWISGDRMNRDDVTWVNAIVKKVK